MQPSNRYPPQNGWNNPVAAGYPQPPPNVPGQLSYAPVVPKPNIYVKPPEAPTPKEPPMYQPGIVNPGFMNSMASMSISSHSPVVNSWTATTAMTTQAAGFTPTISYPPQHAANNDPNAGPLSYSEQPTPAQQSIEPPFHHGHHLHQHHQPAPISSRYPSLAPAALPNQPLVPVPTYPPGESSTIAAAAAAVTAAATGPFATAAAGTQTLERTKSQPSSVPRPCALEKELGMPREYYSRIPVLGQTGQSHVHVPLSTHDFMGVDDGSATIRYARPALFAVPVDENLAKKSFLPLGVSFTPFADSAPGEAPVPIVDLRGTSSSISSDKNGVPLRCERCRAYVNPGFKFVSSGNEFICNICDATSITPPEHRSVVNPATGLRADWDSCPEYRCGSIDILVGSQDYCIRPNKVSAGIVFLVELTSMSVENGLIFVALNAIRYLVCSLFASQPAFMECKLALVTFGKEVCFYDLRSAEEDHALLCRHCVPDVDEPFSPLDGEAFWGSASAIVKVVDSITEEVQTSMQKGIGLPTTSCLGAALMSLKEVLAKRPSKLLAIACSLPSVGVGSLERRSEIRSVKALTEEAEVELMKPLGPFYGDLGSEFGAAYISADMFLAPSLERLDCATLMRFPLHCGGKSFYFPEFSAARDGDCFGRCFVRVVSSVRAFDAVMRLRVSQGMDTGDYVGDYTRPQRGDEVIAPVLGCDSSFAVLLKYTAALKAKSKGSASGGGSSASRAESSCSLQLAILYSDAAGNRRIRIHTVMPVIASTLPDIFRNADVEAVFSIMTKQAAKAILVENKPLSHIRTALIEKCVHILFVYRRYCTSSGAPGQLILPEALKLLPVLLLGFAKSHALCAQPNSAVSQASIPGDERAAALFNIISFSPDQMGRYVYPKAYTFHDLSNAAGMPYPTNQNPVISVGSFAAQQAGGVAAPFEEPYVLPLTKPCTSEILDETGLLVLSDGKQLVVWMGTNVDPELIQDAMVLEKHPDGHVTYKLRGFTADTSMVSDADSDRCRRIVRIIQRILDQSPYLRRLVIIQRGDRASETKYLFPMLVEDRVSATGAWSYVEFLRHIHRKIMDKIASDNASKDFNSWEMLNYGL